MKSKVSFTFDGRHNLTPIKNILTSKLTLVEFKVENNSLGRLKNSFRIYVSAKEDEMEVLKVCKGIQCFAMLDSKEF